MKYISHSFNAPKSSKIELVAPNEDLKNLYFCLTMLHNTEIRAFRVLFGKTVNGQRTGSNGKTSKSLQPALYLYKYTALKSTKSNHLLNKPIFLAEYVNLFWQHQWVSEWVSGFKLLQKLPIYVRRTNFIDIHNMNMFNIYNFYSNPFHNSKKKKQSRRKVIPKNKFATGFPFGFSLTYSKQLGTL